MQPRSNPPVDVRLDRRTVEATLAALAERDDPALIDLRRALTRALNETSDTVGEWLDGQLTGRKRARIDLIQLVASAAGRDPTELDLHALADHLARRIDGAATVTVEPDEHAVTLVRTGRGTLTGVLDEVRRAVDALAAAHRGGV